VYMDNASNSQALEVLRLLHTLPDDLSQHMLRGLREKGSSSAALAALLHSASSNSPPQVGHIGEEPVSRFRNLEEELTTQYPFAYPLFTPISVSALAESKLVHPREDSLQPFSESLYA
jgi:hypothetical protein